MRNRLSGVLLMAVLSGCASSHVEIVGRTRPAISADLVRIYLQPPDSKYEEIANLTASSAGSFRVTAGGKMDAVVERLKREAAKLGANAILLHGVGDQSGRVVGAGVSTEWDSGHSPYGLGFGVFAVFRHKSGDGVAMYVEPR